MPLAIRTKEGGKMTASNKMSDTPDSDTVFDTRGDVRLRVGTGEYGEPGPITFTACSRALARASPVFERMLYGHFRESKMASEAAGAESDEWTVDLPEDKPQTLRILLNLAHAHFQKIPNRPLSIDEVYELSTLTNYYDSTRLLVPWMGRLMPSLDAILTAPTGDDNTILPKMLWVSWEFGLRRAFEDLSKKMLMESQGAWTADEIATEVHTPPDILGKPPSPSYLLSLPHEILIIVQNE